MNTYFCLIYVLKQMFTKKQNIQVLHKTDHIMVVNKSHDLKINSNNENEVTVQTLLKQMYPNLVNKKLIHEFYFPHRLDYATSGLICIPLHKKACQLVSKAFLKRKIKKYYIALVRGIFSKEIVDLDIPIGEDSRQQNIQKMCTVDSRFCMKPRNARTIFLVLEEGIYDQYLATKILIKPVTGRRHQIRIHCSFLGHTIIGDYTYSNRKDNKPYRMFLHSSRLVLPTLLEIVDVEARDPFKNVSKWKSIKIENNIDDRSYEKLESVCYEK